MSRSGYAVVDPEGFTRWDSPTVSAASGASREFLKYADKDVTYLDIYALVDRGLGVKLGKKVKRISRASVKKGSSKVKRNPRSKAKPRYGVYVGDRLAYVSSAKADSDKAARKLRASGAKSIKGRMVGANPVSGKIPAIGWRTQFKAVARQQLGPKALSTPVRRALKRTRKSGREVSSAAGQAENPSAGYTALGVSKDGRERTKQVSSIEEGKRFLTLYANGAVYKNTTGSSSPRRVYSKGHVGTGSSRNPTRRRNGSTYLVGVTRGDRTSLFSERAQSHSQWDTLAEAQEYVSGLRGEFSWRIVRMNDATHKSKVVARGIRKVNSPSSKHSASVPRKVSGRYSYEFSFTVDGRRQKWTLFGKNMESTLRAGKRAAKKEWPGSEPHGFLIRRAESNPQESLSNPSARYILFKPSSHGLIGGSQVAGHEGSQAAMRKVLRDYRPRLSADVRLMKMSTYKALVKKAKAEGEYRGGPGGLLLRSKRNPAKGAGRGVHYKYAVKPRQQAGWTYFRTLAAARKKAASLVNTLGLGFVNIHYVKDGQPVASGWADRVYSRGHKGNPVAKSRNAASMLLRRENPKRKSLSTTPPRKGYIVEVGKSKAIAWVGSTKAEALKVENALTAAGKTARTYQAKIPATVEDGLRKSYAGITRRVSKNPATGYQSQKGYYKVWFSSPGIGKTAGLVLNVDKHPYRGTTVSDYSRLYPASQAMKMQRFHRSPIYTTWKEAFEYKGRGEKAKRNPTHKARLGSGGRFKACVVSARKGGASDPAGVCAAAGRRKYGARRMAKMAATGRKRAATKNPIGPLRVKKVKVGIYKGLWIIEEQLGNMAWSQWASFYDTKAQAEKIVKKYAGAHVHTKIKTNPAKRLAVVLGRTRRVAYIGTEANAKKAEESLRRRGFAPSISLAPQNYKIGWREDWKTKAA